MKFEELKKSLADSKSKNYIIAGKDLFLCDNTYRLIFDSLNIEMRELNEIKFAGVEVDFVDVVSALNSPAVFSDNKIVLVDMTNKFNKYKNIDALNKYLDANDYINTLVVRVGDNADGLKGVNTKAFTQVECNELQRDVAIKLLTIEAKKMGRTITPEAVSMVLDYTNSDLMYAINEINKLSNYSSSQIVAGDVDTLTAKGIDYKIYELTEALAKKNVSKVYEILGDLKHKKNGYQGLLALIYSHFRRLLHIAITKLSFAEYAEIFGIKEYAVKKSAEQAYMFKPKKLKEINDMCMDLEYQLKTSQINPVNAVEMLVLNILS